MKLLDFFYVRLKHCTGRNTQGHNCTVYRKQGKPYNTPVNPWYCPWQQKFPEELQFALDKNLVEYSTFCIYLTSRGHAMYRQLKGDYS